MAARGPGGSPEPADLENARRAEATALERFARERVPRLLGLARRLLAAESEARAAVREAFGEVARAGHSLEDPAASELLESATVRAALRRARRGGGAGEATIEDLLPRFLQDGHHEQHPPDWSDAALRDERQRAIQATREALWRLPADEREALVLRDVRGVDSRSAARDLGVDEAELKRRLHRARLAVRGLLEAPLRKGAL